MLELAKDILSANNQRKLLFTNELCGLTTSVDYKIVKIISSDDIMFGQTLVALIRTALIYAKDNTAALNQELKEYFDDERHSTNFTNTLPPSPQVSPTTTYRDLNQQQTIPNPDNFHTKRDNITNMDNNNNKRVGNNQCLKFKIKILCGN